MPQKLDVLLYLTLIAAQLVAANARADEPRALASLSWGPGPCASGEDLEDRVEAQLGRRVFVPANEAQLRIVGRVVPREDQVLARFEFQRGAELLGSRELLASDCTELARALPIVIALAVDVAAQAVRLVVPSPSTQAGVSQLPTQALAPTASERSNSLTFALRAGAGVDLGLLPTPAYSARLALRLEAPDIPALELRAAFLFPSSSLREGRGVVLWAGSVSLATCPRIAGEGVGWRLEACGGVDAGVLNARGEGFTLNRETLTPLVDVFAGLRLALRFAQVAISLEASFVVPLPATRFTVTGLDGSEFDVSAGEPVGARFELALASVP